MAVFYPDANPESTSVDGRVSRTDVNESFSTIRSGAGTGSEDSNAQITMAAITASATTNQYAAMERSIYLFDTSSIPDDAIILSATISLYITIKGNGLGNLDFNIYASTPASNTAIQNSDYGQIGTTPLATSILVNDININAYNTWTLNATGLAAISNTGITKLALRAVNDATNTAPTWSSGAGTFLVGQTADGANKPTLTVTWSLPTTTSTTTSTTTTSTSTTQSTSTTYSTSTSTTTTSTSTTTTLAPNCGAASPTTAPNTVWVNPTNAYSSDDSYATANTAVDYQRYGGFNFGLVGDPTITGITVSVEGNGATGGETLRIYLWNQSSGTWTAAKENTFTSGADVTRTYGGSFDTWGKTWLLSDLASGTFLIRGITPNGGQTVNVDHIQVSVCRYEGTTTSTTTSSSTSTTTTSTSTTNSTSSSTSSSTTSTSRSTSTTQSTSTSYSTSTSSTTTLSPTCTSLYYPTATGDDYNCFDSSTYAFLSDDSRSASAGNCGSIDYQDYYNFNISIPEGAIITGIKLHIEGKDDALDLPFLAALSWDGGTTYTDNKSNSFNSLTDVVKEYGGSFDTWGHSWSVSDLSNANFRVRVGQNPFADVIEIDTLQIEVCYYPTITTTSTTTSTSTTSTSTTQSTSTSSSSSTSTTSTSTTQSTSSSSSTSSSTTTSTTTTPSQPWNPQFSVKTTKPGFQMNTNQPAFKVSSTKPNML